MAQNILSNIDAHATIASAPASGSCFQAVCERFLSLKDVADRLNISTRSVWRLIARSELPKPLKFGKTSRFSSTELDDYIETIKQKRKEI